MTIDRTTFLLIGPIPPLQAVLRGFEGLLCHPDELDTFDLCAGFLCQPGGEEVVGPVPAPSLPRLLRHVQCGTHSGIRRKGQTHEKKYHEVFSFKVSLKIPDVPFCRSEVLELQEELKS